MKSLESVFVGSGVHFSKGLDNDSFISDSLLF